MKTGKVANGMLAFTVLMENMTLRLVFFCPFPPFFLLDTSSVFVYERFFAENERMSLDMKRFISFFWENEGTSRVSVIWRVAVCEEGSRRVIHTHFYGADFEDCGDCASFKRTCAAVNGTVILTSAQASNWIWFVFRV